MAKVGDLLVNIGADISDFKNKMSSVQKQMKAVGNSMKDIGQDMSMGLSAPIAGIGTAMIVTASNFEKSMNKVRAISGATGEEFESLEAQAKELGSTTQFSASQAAEGMSFLAMAGFETNEIMKAMPGMLDLAASAQMDLAQAADIASNIMSGFQIEAENAGHVSDVLAKTASSANTSVHQLGMAMKYAAPVAQGLGLSMEETAAAIGFMSDAGIQGSLAGTAMRGGLTRLAKPSKKAAELMNELGIEVFDAEGNMKSMEGIITEFNSNMKNLSQEQRAGAIATIFGQEAMSGWLAVLGRGSKELKGFSTELVNSDGAAKRMADTMNEGTAGAFKEFKSALEGLAISFSDILLPPITKAIDKLTALTRWFTSLSIEAKTIITVFAGIVATIGPLLIVTGSLVSAFMTILPVISAVGSAIAGLGASVILPFIAVIGALVAAGILLYKNWQTVKAYAIEIWGAIWSFIKPTVLAIKTFILTHFNIIKNWWMITWPTLKQAFINIWNAIMAFIKPVVNQIVAIFKWAWPFVKSIIIETWNSIKKIISNVLNIIMNLISAFANLFTGNWSELWENIKSILLSAIKILWEIIKVWFLGKILKVFKFFKDEIGRITKHLWAEVKSFFRDGARWALKKVASMTKGIRGKFKGMLNFIKGLGKSFYNAGKGLINMMKRGIEAAASKVISAVQRIANKVRNMLPFSPAKEGPLSDLDKLDFAGPMVKSIKSGIPQVQGMMSRMLSLPSMQMNSTSLSKTTSTPFIINLDGREIARGTMPHMTREIRLNTGGDL